MIVLSYGMTKSGSTLAFELCKSVLQQRGYDQRRLPDGAVAPWHHINFFNTLTVENLQRALDEVSPKEIIAVKTHVAIGPDERAFIEKRIAEASIKVHVNYRDPREVCLSLVDAGVQARERGRPAFAEIHTLADAARIVRRQLGVCRRWGAVRGALHLYYNDVAFDTRHAVDQMCTDFGFELLSPAEYDTIVDGLFHNTFTQKNKAVIDRYKELTDRQNAFLIEQIPGIQDFISRVCVERDHSWFRPASATAERAALR